MTMEDLQVTQSFYAVTTLLRFSFRVLFSLSPCYSQNIYLSLPYYEIESGGDITLGILG